MVSVGLPVRNGEPYLATAIDSLLNQSYANIELIIADNASTDRTMEIARWYRSNDERVVLLHSPFDEGAVANYRKTLSHARGEFFKWSAHDDVCRPAFIEMCVQALKDAPTAVLAYPRTALVDHRGEVVGTESPRPALDACDPVTRLRELGDLNSSVTPLFGVIRRQELVSVRPHGRYPGADRILLMELALRGRFVAVDDVLFEFRQHEEQYSSSEITSQFKSYWWTGKHSDRPAAANWKRLAELIRAVRVARLTARERRSCYAEILRWSARYWNRLALDVRLIAGWTVRSTVGGRRSVGRL